MLSRDILIELYQDNNLSMKQIADRLECSHNQVAYWMTKHDIKRRTISDAVYQRINPSGDPFIVLPIDSLEKAQLFGMGLGLYWGEGTKANKYAVRLGNSDPELLRTFMRFLIELFGIKQSDLKFGLQIFTDIDEGEALAYWTTRLNVREDQFYKIHKTISGSLGMYRTKSKYGVVTLYYHNKRLRDIIVGLLPR